MHDAYQEHIRDNAAVCSNCLRTVKVERVDPTRSGMGVEYEERLARHERHTEIGYGPAESVTDEKGVFCTHCGTEHANDRIWAPENWHDPTTPLDEERFHELVRHAYATLSDIGVSLNRDVFISIAVKNFRNYHDPDYCLAEALEIGLASAAMGAANERDQRARAD